MDRIYYLLVLFLLSTFSALSQIGLKTETADQSSVLDVVSTDKGLLIPRMTDLQKMAISSPQEGLLVYDTSLECISMYTYIQSKSSMGWTCLSLIPEKFFYMPSISIPTSDLGTNKTINLYTEYHNQFLSATTPNITKNPSAPDLKVYDVNQLNFYVTYYDTNIMKIKSIDDTGLMTYDIIGHANFDSYVNVIFVIK